MHTNRRLLARVLASVPFLLAAGMVVIVGGRPSEAVTLRAAPTSVDRPLVQGLTSADLAVVLTDVHREAVAAWYAVATWNETAARSSVLAAPRRPERHQAPSASLVAMSPCGGDLPPCWVKNRESHGNYAAVNWSGCGGHGCFGAWQFSGEWAGRLGLPDDLTTATPEQQDNAARILWDGGRGCGNWGAC